MNKEALEALDRIIEYANDGASLRSKGNSLALEHHSKHIEVEKSIIVEALTQEVSNEIVINKVNQAVHTLEKHKNIANATYVDEVEEVSKDTKTIRTEIKRLREDIKSCDIIEVIPLIQPSNRSVKDYAQKHLLSHVDEIEKQLEIMNSKQEVSKDTNVEEVEETKLMDLITDYRGEDNPDIVAELYNDIIEEIKHYINKIYFLEKLNKCNRYVIDVPKEVNKFLEDFKRTGTKIICNEDGSVDVEEPNQSAKEMFEDVDVSELQKIYDYSLGTGNHKRLYTLQQVIDKLKELQND